MVTKGLEFQFYTGERLALHDFQLHSQKPPVITDCYEPHTHNE